jgi:signal peptidase I
VCLFTLFIAYGLANNRWYHVLVVNGGSMEPVIHWGDAVVITRPPHELRPGMIITMEVEGQLVTHRVIATHPLVTKGDANSAPDQWKGSQVRVVGQVRFTLPKLGQVMRRLHVALGDLTGSYFHSRAVAPGMISAASRSSATEASAVIRNDSRAAIGTDDSYMLGGSILGSSNTKKQP